MVNFTACQAAFLTNETNLDLFSYHGSVADIKGEGHRYITFEGCNKLCGAGSDLYPWSISADTILTWVLPMLVMFLLAPFEPNQMRNTFWSAIRWMGSPFVSMWYVLYNISMTGRCAEMVDMAVPYSGVPDEDSEYSDFRDAMLILSAMNQYLPDARLSAGAESFHAEQVLRFALYGGALLPESGISLQRKRKKIAGTIRTRRRRGVVPLLVGFLWFLFVLALSISFTFSDIGDTTAAHNLAMGFAVSWIPPLVIGSVVDRNPTATKDLRVKFNKLLREVRDLLRTPAGKQLSPDDAGSLSNKAIAALDINMPDVVPDEFFTDFAGQGRLRWHSGVAHPIIAGIRKSFAADYGRGWLDQGGPARRAMIQPCGTKGFEVADSTSLIPALAAFAIVYGSIIAGFLLSYFTPTVGLGCRSAGYLLLGILTLTAALGEVCVEFVSTPNSKLRWIGHWPLATLELINVCWLVWIMIAQTFGVYQTCYCLSSDLDRRGGYIEFDNLGHDDSAMVVKIWSFATGIAGFVLISSLTYIVAQWMEQSHLMTSDYDSARRGLM